MKTTKRYLQFKYDKIIKGFEGEIDDRKLASNIYKVLLKACDDMQGIDNSLINVAVRKEIRENEKQIDGIIERFTGKKYNQEKAKWEDKND